MWHVQLLASLSDINITGPSHSQFECCSSKCFVEALRLELGALDFSISVPLLRILAGLSDQKRRRKILNQKSVAQKKQTDVASLLRFVPKRVCFPLPLSLSRLLCLRSASALSFISLSTSIFQMYRLLSPCFLLVCLSKSKCTDYLVAINNCMWGVLHCMQVQKKNIAHEGQIAHEWGLCCTDVIKI